MNRRRFLRWLFTLGKPDPRLIMPRKFEALALYNGEVGRGICHTVDFNFKMARLQAEFEAWVEGLDPDSMDLRLY